MRIFYTSLKHFNFLFYVFILCAHWSSYAELNPTVAHVATFYHSGLLGSLKVQEL